MARRAVFRAVAVALTLAACASACSPSSADRSSGGATGVVPTEPPRTTTTNPYAVPAVIDVAYVNRVLAGLDAAAGDITRLVVRTRTIPREAYDRLKAIYADPDFMQIQIDNFQSDIRKNFAGYRSEPGNKQTTVSQLITARPTCIFARVQRDYSAVATGTPNTALGILWVALRPLDKTRDLSSFNMTAWAYVYDGFPPDHSQPIDPCAV